MTDSILEKLIRSRDDLEAISREAQRLYGRAQKKPAIFSPHQTFKVTRTPPYVVFDYALELEKQARGHWQLSEFGRINYGSLLRDGRIGLRAWNLIMFDTHTYLSFSQLHADHVQIETFIVVKRAALEPLIETAQENNLLFVDPLFDFIETNSDSAPEEPGRAGQTGQRKSNH